MAPQPVAVIFDPDGTLIDHVGAVTAALGRWLPALGSDVTPELVRAWFAAEELHFAAWRARQISFAEQRRRRLRDFLPLMGITSPGDDGLDQLFAGYLAHYEASWMTYPDVDGALAALAETTVELAVLTNGSTQQQNANLDAVGLGGRVGPVFTAEELGVAKPDPSAYLIVCRSLEVDPSAVLHVGDVYDLDVIAPRAAGLQAVHLDRIGTGPREESARIASLDQLPALLGYG